jgi:chromosome segregation ATPase
MKTIFTIIFLMLIPIFGIKGQRPITVAGDSLKFGKSSMPGLSVNIPEANYEKTLKTWIKTLESGTKSKVAKENNELSIFGANIKDISLTPVNIYSKIVTRDSMLQLSASFELGKDKYIEKAKSEADYAKALNFLKQFAKNEYLEVAKERVNVEDKKLKDLEKDLASLEKEKARLQKSIQSNNTTITNEKDNIALQNNDLKTVTASITDNNSQLTSMDEGAAKEERQKYIKELEKRKKKILSSIESSENKINSSNSATDKATGEIATNETMQVTAKEKITQQTLVLQKFTDKMEKIKLY